MGIELFDKHLDNFQFPEALSALKQDESFSESDKLPYEVLLYTFKRDFKAASKALKRIGKTITPENENEVNWILLILKMIVINRQHYSLPEFSKIISKTEKLQKEMSEKIPKKYERWENWFKTMKGRHALIQGNPEKSITFFKEVLEHREELPSKLEKAIAHQDLGSYHRQIGNIQEARSYFNEALHIGRIINNSETIQISLNELGWIENSKSDYKRSLEYFQEAMDIAKAEKDKLHIAISESNIGQLYWKMGRNDDSLELLKSSLRSVEDLDNKIWIAKNNMGIGNCFWTFGEYDKAGSFYHKSKIIWEELGILPELASTLHNIGLINVYTGKLDPGLEFYNRALEIYKRIGNRRDIASTLANIGPIHRMKGDHQLALEKIQNALGIMEEVGSETDISNLLLMLAYQYMIMDMIDEACITIERCINIRETLQNSIELAAAYQTYGGVLRKKNELEKALEYYNKALEIIVPIDNKSIIVSIKSSIALILDQIGNPPAALQLMTEVYDARKKIGNLSELGETVFNLVTLLVEQDDLELAKSFQEELSLIAKEVNRDYLYNLNLLARGLILKNSKRLVQKAAAQKIFEELVANEKVSHRESILAMLNLLSLLLDELKTYNEEEVLIQIEQLSSRIQDLVQKNSSADLVIDVLLLQAKFQQLKGDLVKSDELRKKALNMAETKKLDKLREKVNGEQEQFEAELNKWKQMIKEGKSIYERLEEMDLNDYIMRVKQITIAD